MGLSNPGRSISEDCCTKLVVAELVVAEQAKQARSRQCWPPLDIAIMAKHAYGNDGHCAEPWPDNNHGKPADPDAARASNSGSMRLASLALMFLAASRFINIQYEVLNRTSAGYLAAALLVR